MNNLATNWLPTFSPVNDAERIAAGASSNINCLAVGADIMSQCVSADSNKGPRIATATPTGATAGNAGEGVQSAMSAAANLYIGMTNPGGCPFQCPNWIQPTANTASQWQKVGLVTLGSITNS